MTHIRSLSLGLISSLSLAACDLDDEGTSPDVEMRAKPVKFTPLSDDYNLHLASVIRYPALQPDADDENGRKLFGIAEDLETEDKTNALFEGASVEADKLVVSNTRTCFTCHRGTPDGFGLPMPPLLDHIEADDALFTGIDADAGGDPRAKKNLEELGLIKYRVNRFNPLEPDSPFVDVFGWRKSPKLLNIGLQMGFLTDCRGRVLQDAARGAAFAHTQNGDVPFNDLFPAENANDVEAFLVTLFSDPQLEALRDPEDPSHKNLINAPYSTVELTTKAEKAGRRVFDENCFVCHNMPNVFSNLDNVEPLADGTRPPSAISWNPAIGRTFNIGVSERNKHKLDFHEYLGTDDYGKPKYAPIELTLANEDGTSEYHTVEIDIGLAMTTRRTKDIGRFKVPQLRDLAANAPYFHDNSAESIEEVVDYFNDDDYNESADGQDHPIHLTPEQQADLIAFLYAL